MELLDGDLELGGHLLVGRRALEPGLELHVGALDLPRAGAHRARHPVERPQLVDDRAADPRDRVGLELDLAGQVEPLDRRDQPAEPVGDQVGLLDVGRQARAHPPGDVLDQRRVGDDEPLARALVPGGLVPPPQVLQLDRFDVGFQVVPRDLAAMPVDERARRRIAGAPTLPECRPGSSRCSRGRAVPGSPAGRRRLRADGSRTSAAARADGPARAPASGATARRAQARSRRRDVGGRQPPAGLRQEQRRARTGRRRPRAPGGRGPGSARARRSACSPDRDEPRLAALALDPHRLGVEVDRVDVERHELLGAQAGRVGELEQRPVAQLERRRRRESVEQRRHLGRLQHARQALRASWASSSRSAGFSARAPSSIWTRNSPRSAASLRATVAGACPRSDSPAA